MARKYPCIIFAILCFAANIRTMFILDDERSSISDKHKRTVHTMLQEAYQAHKEASWPDLREDNIKIHVDNDRIQASGMIDLSNCIVHNASYPEIEVRINNGQIEVTKPYEVYGDAQFRSWVISCVIGVANLCAASVYAWRTLSSFCRNGSAKNPEYATSMDKPKDHLD